MQTLLYKSLQRVRNVRARSDQGFQLSSTNNGVTDRLTEEAETIKENNNVKVVLKSQLGTILQVTP